MKWFSDEQVIIDQWKRGFIITFLQIAFCNTFQPAFNHRNILMSIMCFLIGIELARLPKICLTFTFLPKNTNMVVALCMFNIHKCVIYHFNQNVTADAKRYHTYVYVEHTWYCDHICTRFWRSVSASGHGNMSLNKLPRPTRVRIRPPPPLRPCILRQLNDQKWLKTSV